MFLQYARMVESAGWSGLTRAARGRFSDVGSSMNCASVVWDGLSRIALQGKYWEISFSRSGITFPRVSVVPLHLVSKWTMSSVGGG